MHAKYMALPFAALMALGFNQAAQANVECKYIVDNTKGDVTLDVQVTYQDGDGIEIDGKEYTNKGDYQYQVAPGKESEARAYGDHKCGMGAAIMAHGDTDNIEVSTLGYMKKDAGEGGEKDCETGDSVGDFQGKYNYECDGNVSEKNNYTRITITAK